MLALNVAQQGSRNAVAGEQQQCSHERDDLISRQHRDGEKNRGHEEGVRHGEDKYPFKMSAPDDPLKPLWFHPGHVSRQQNADGNPEHWNHGHQGGSEESPEQKVAATERSREDDLIGVVAEIARRRRIHKGGHHQQRQQPNHRIVVLDYERRVAVGVAERLSNRDMVRADRAEKQGGNDQRENPEHPRTQPVADFEPRDVQKHASLSSTRGCK